MLPIVGLYFPTYKTKINKHIRKTCPSAYPNSKKKMLNSQGCRACFPLFAKIIKDHLASYHKQSLRLRLLPTKNLTIICFNPVTINFLTLQTDKQKRLDL